jgi:hypothetical protein
MADDPKLITVILPQGQGRPLLQDLFERKQLRASLGTARAPVTTVSRRGGLARTQRYSVEKDILQVVVAAGDAADVFAFLHERAGIGERYGGFMYQGSLSRAGVFTLPDGLPHG